ncbi:hypothetical protein Clacol_004636 [Clathrus columnatus]|uniref:PX domain-containing protein n=1 Tax=Clathrus columnatus TaxID=1419009 RepID=A0AAV5A820_9AGAM|nr:hypothetical protein Clacol_004636 [Clathrus columnatus]
MSLDSRPELSSIILSPTPWPNYVPHFDPYMLATVKEPSIKEIDGSDVEFYPITIQTNYEGFPSYSVVKRRYSEFQQFHRLLIDKGLHPPALRWTRHIPSFKGKSRREELQEFLNYVTEEDSLSLSSDSSNSAVAMKSEASFKHRKMTTFTEHIPVFYQSYRYRNV